MSETLNSQPMKSKVLRRRFRIARIVLALPLGMWLAFTARAVIPETSGASTKEEFFIVSSVDLKKNRMVLKRPTEVTELVQVTDKTQFLDEQKKRLQFKDLRAGDTVYVSFSRIAGGPRIAARIRKAPMTLEELHHRYLDFK